MPLTKVTSGVRTLGTGEVTASNVENTFDISSKTVTLPAASVTTHVTAFDDSSVRNDIATLALHSAIADNKAAHNLSNSFIDQFEDSTGIDTTSSVTRDATSEYMSAGSSVTPDSNTLLYMSCDGSDSGTTFTDEGPTGHTLVTLGNAHTDTTIKKFGTASLQMDGTGDGVRVSGSHVSGSDFELDSSDWTLECWMYATSGAGEDYLMSKIDNDRSNYNSLNWQITHTSKIMRIDLQPTGDPSGGAQTMNTTSHPSYDTWHHVAVVREGNTVTQYRDGNSVGTMSFTEALYPATGYNFVIGTTDGSTYGFLGYLDTIRVSDVARYSGSTYTVPSGPDATTSPFKYNQVNALSLIHI